MDVGAPEGRDRPRERPVMAMSNLTPYRIEPRTLTPEKCCYKKNRQSIAQLTSVDPDGLVIGDRGRMIPVLSRRLKILCP